MNSIVAILMFVAAEVSAAPEPINLVDFARVVEYSGETPETFEARELIRGTDGWDAWQGEEGQYMIGVEWDEPRDVAEVNIEFRHAIADRYKIRVQYFRTGWPYSEQNDAFHGRWVTAKADWWAGDRDVSFAFVPYKQEQPGKDAPGMCYRRTYRLRFLLGDRELPPVRYIRAYGRNESVEAEFDIRFDDDNVIVKPPLDVSVVNGSLLEEDADSTTQTSFLLASPGSIRVRYFERDLQTATRTVVTLRNSYEEMNGLSFLPAEVVKYGTIRIPSLGVVIEHRGGKRDLQDGGRSGESIYDRIANGPEPSFQGIEEELSRWCRTQPAALPVNPSAMFEVPEPGLNYLYAKVPELIAGSVEAEAHDKPGRIDVVYQKIRALEIIGRHDLAERLLMTVVREQSRNKLRGRFTDFKGVFGSLPMEQTQGRPTSSGLNQGYALWMLNEHYRFTRDRQWLVNIAHALISGCDFITRQRKTEPEANLICKDDPYWVEGLLPPGTLDDKNDWHWWFTVNAYAYRGVRATAESLLEIGHSQAKLIARQAEVFGERLRKSCKESMIRAPVVGLRDNTYVPAQPMCSRSRVTGAEGWRGGILGPVHLVDCGLYADDSPEAEWILRDVEDNLSSPLPIPTTRPLIMRGLKWGNRDEGRRNLLPITLLYLRRGQYKHAAPLFEGGPEGDAGISYGAECIVWFRHLLVMENGRRLDLLAGVPSSWLAAGKRIKIEKAPTWYGPMNMRVESLAELRQIKIELEGPQRNPPESIRLYLRTPQPFQSVRI
ncbi:MAG: hypothetical protein JSV03_12535, partial [Planctomycetota bacterium]